MDSEYAAVESAVRRWFVGEDEAAWPVGKLGEFARLQSGVKKSERLVRVEFHPKISRLDVLQIGEGQAVVELRAREASEVAHRDFGLRHYVRRYDGPVVLRRVDDEWRVEDFCMDGRLRSKAIFLFDRARQTVKDVTVSLRAVTLETRGTRVIFEVENGSDSSVEVAAAALGRPWLRGRTLYRALAITSAKAVSSNEKLLVLASRKMRALPLDTRSVALAVFVVDPETDTRREFFIRTPLVEDGGLVETSETVPRDLRLITKVRLVGVLALLVALPIALAALRNWTYLGAILIAEGGAFLMAVLQVRRRTRRALLFAAAGITLVVAGLLSVASGSGRIGV